MTVQCDRCKRETSGWPLKRADVCSPKHWARCIRQPWNVKPLILQPTLIEDDGRAMVGSLTQPGRPQAHTKRTDQR